MSYIDETYGQQLEEALRGLVSRPALGQPWFGFHASEVPAGVLLFTATTHSRVLYADFWEYIQDKNLVKTEEEWQSIYSEQGWCPFYSDGDGIDTFRMPSAPLYLHGANTLGEAGKYIKEGLPNITGEIYQGVSVDYIQTPQGCFTASRTSGGAKPQSTAGSGDLYLIFDASSSNPIYGNSDAVTPETSKMLFGVWAISAPQQPIPDATVEGIISELDVVSNTTSEAKTKAEIAINGLNSAIRSVNGISADIAGNVSTIPDYSAGVSISSGFSAPSAGIVIITIRPAAMQTYYSFILKVNNTKLTEILVYAYAGADGSYQTMSFAVDKDDKVTLETISSYPLAKIESFIFYPIKHKDNV